jgi:hypothetical protein
MKKWFFLIVPGCMLGVFLFFYSTHVKEAELRSIERAKVQAQKDAEDKRHKAELEDKARQDAARKAAERAAEEAAKEAQKIANWNEAGQKIKDETNKYLAEGDASTKKINALELELEATRAKYDKLNRELLDLLKAVELAKIDRRNAELEIQRMTEKIARRAADSSLTRMPTPAPKSS